jgi:hypothetical protein
LLLFAGAAVLPGAPGFARDLLSPGLLPRHGIGPRLSAPPASAPGYGATQPATPLLPADELNYGTLPPAAPLPPADELNYGTLEPAAPLPPTAGLGLSLPSPFGSVLDPAAIDADDAGAAARGNPEAGATIPAPSLARARPGKLHLDCAVIPQTLQSGGEYWQTLPYAAMPARLAPPGRPGASLADPIRGPSGNRTNLQAPGPAGAWCRPPPIPIADTSPLANRGFWIPASLVLFGIGVFWLSRGLALPP